MDIIESTNNLLEQASGKRLVKILCCLSELDIGSQDDYEFLFCSKVFLVFDDCQMIIRSCDIDSNYSILSSTISKLELDKEASRLSKLGVEISNILPKSIDKIMELNINWMYEKITSITLKSDSQDIKICSGNVLEENNLAKIIEGDEMLLVYSQVK